MGEERGRAGELRLRRPAWRRLRRGATWSIGGGATLAMRRTRRATATAVAGGRMSREGGRIGSNDGAECASGNCSCAQTVSCDRPLRNVRHGSTWRFGVSRQPIFRVGDGALVVRRGGAPKLAGDAKRASQERRNTFWLTSRQS